MRPREFWRLTPAEFYTTASGFYAQEAEREKSAYRRDAHFTACLMNATGNYKRTVRAEDLVGFKDDDKGERPLDPDKRRREFLETARHHKSKFWTVINGDSLDDIKLPAMNSIGEAGTVPALPDMRVERVKAIIAG